MTAVRDPTRTVDDPEATEQTRATVLAFLNALVAGGEYENHFGQQVTHSVMETGELTRGRDAVVRLINHLFRQAFATSVVVRGLIVEGRRAILEAEFAGTHVGEFAGISPTGRAVRVSFAVAYDLADGIIAALRVYLPMDDLVRQIRGA